MLPEIHIYQDVYMYSEASSLMLLGEVDSLCKKIIEKNEDKPEGQRKEKIEIRSSIDGSGDTIFITPDLTFDHSLNSNSKDSWFSYLCNYAQISEQEMIDEKNRLLSNLRLFRESLNANELDAIQFRDITSEAYNEFRLKVGHFTYSNKERILTNFRRDLKQVLASI